MANTRLSNETLAKVLVKAIEDLDEKLNKFTEQTNKAVSKPISIDSTEINASIDKLRGVSLDLNTSITKLSQQTSNPLAKWFGIVNLGIFVGCIIMGVVLYFRLEKYSEKMRDIQGLENIKANVQQWFNDQPKQYEAYQKWKDAKK